MKNLMKISFIAALLTAALTASMPPKTGKITRMEPLSWWTGMKNDLQLMVQGKDLAEYDVFVEGLEGISLRKVHKADNPNFLFLDIDIAENASAGTLQIVFKRGKECIRQPFLIQERSDGSATRGSFTTEDLIYLIVPDRFANGDSSNDSCQEMAEAADRSNPDGRHGGDIQGIIDHLDYISDLGATTIWSTPLLKDDDPKCSYHGYACSDYYHIDPRYGSNEQYRDLVHKAHEKGLKVVLDVVTNHSSTRHWWMEDMPFSDWVHMNDPYVNTNHVFSLIMDPNASQADRKIVEEGWFVPTMPDMNLDNPFLLKYFQMWAIWWIEYSGLDGLRVDTFYYNEKEPMARWCDAVIEEYPDFNIVGECWSGRPDLLAYWQKGHVNADGFSSALPSIMDFPLRDAISQALSPRNGQDGDIYSVYEALSHDLTYHDLSKMMIFLSNHDTARIGDTFGGNADKAKLAFTLLATLRGIPQMFYGDEMMFMTHRPGREDGRLRMDFPGGWEGDKCNLFTEEGRKAVRPAGREEFASAAPLYDYVRTLMQWRKGKGVIHNGKTLHFVPQDNTYGYFRYNDSEAVFVFINNSSEDVKLGWSRYAEMGASCKDGRNVLTGDALTLSDDTIVPACSALVVEFNR